MGDEVDAFSEELRRRPEVRTINKYAVVAAYIRITLKSVGALVLLWATVVLLGGFVSFLTEDDFWSLTIITFLQAAGVFDTMGFDGMDLFQDWYSYFTSFIRSWGEKHRHQHTQLPMRKWLKKHMQKLVSTIINITLGVLYAPLKTFIVSGPAVCLFLSVHRVRKQDYGNADGETSKANLKRALNLFYYAACAHSLICLSWMLIQTAVSSMLVDIVSRQHGFRPNILRAYLSKTKHMFLSNPTSTMKWNLITYGTGLLDSHLPEDYAAGGRVLAMLVDMDIPLQIRRLLIKSPRQRIQKLIRTLAWKSPHEQEMRWLAARIVEHLASDLNLAHFPGALECVSSLLDEYALLLTFIPGQGTKDLVLPGLRILENLAHDGHNCTLIYNTKGLLSKIVAPVCSNKLVEDIKSSTAWAKVVGGSLKVVSRLMGSPGSLGEEMRSLIARDSNAVNNLEAILDMDMKSNSSVIVLQIGAIEVLAQLALHHPASSDMGIRETLIQRVLHMFVTADWMGDYVFRSMMEDYLKDKKQTNSRMEKKLEEDKETASRLKEKAGEVLAMLSSDSEAIKSFAGCKNEDVHHLTELLDSNVKTIVCKVGAVDTDIEIRIGCRISAAVILKHLRNYDKEPILRKVLGELLPIQAEASSTPRCWECVPDCTTANIEDMENQLGAGQDKHSTSPSHHIQQCGDRMLQAELLSLVASILANSNFNFAEVLISPPASDSLLEDFVVRLKKMVEDNVYPTPACLAIQKLTCEMVTGFLQHVGSVEVIDRHKIIGALLEASKAMDGLESSMLFAGVSHDCHGVPLKPLSSVLANTAQDLLRKTKQDLSINIAPAVAQPP